MSDKLTIKHVIVYIILIGIMALMVTLLSVVDAQLISFLLDEGGVIETASALGYFLCIALLLYMGGTTSLKSHWYLHIIFLAMALRELDFDKRFTATGVLKSKFVFADDVGLVGKVVGLSIVLIVLLSIFTWIRFHAKEFFVGIFQLKTPSWAAGFAMAFVVFTKSIDGLSRKLEPLGLAVSTDVSILAGRIEEVFELGIPILLLYAIFLYWCTPKLDKP